MFVAQLDSVTRPASSNTVGSEPATKFGAALKGFTPIAKVCVADVSTPPFAVPPVSVIRNVIVLYPWTFAAGVYVSVPAGETNGGTSNKLGSVLPTISNETN